MTKSPKFSILIPSYNYSKYIGKAIKSALLQSHDSFEVIILDNCSTDDTEKIVTQYAKESDLITFFKNAENIGGINNFNKLLKLARGTYIKFLFADDIIEPDALINFEKILDYSDGISLVTSHFEYFGSKSYEFHQPKTGKISGLEAIRSTLVNGNWIGAPTNVCFRKKDIVDINFSDKWQWWVDLEFWHKLLLKGDLYVIPKILSKFNLHEKSATDYCIQNYIDVHNEYYYLKKFQNNDLIFDKEIKFKLHINAVNWVSLLYVFLQKKDLKAVYLILIASYKEKIFLKALKILVKKTFKI